jgi:hypothetical protein
MQCLRGEKWIGLRWSWSGGLREVGSDPCQELPGVSAAQERLNLIDSGAAAILSFTSTTSHTRPNSVCQEKRLHFQFSKIILTFECSLSQCRLILGIFRFCLVLIVPKIFRTFDVGRLVTS